MILIAAHAGFGAIALIAGICALLFAKGSRPHRKAGLMFTLSMGATAASAILIAALPDLWSPFLLAIGIFSLYLIISGYRAIRLGIRFKHSLVDRGLATIMLLTAFGMLLLPFLLGGKFNVVLGVFGLLGGFLAARDLVVLRRMEVAVKHRLQRHIGNMLGGYIAAVTAFVVVNGWLPGYWAWFAPGVAGGALITYWMIKVARGFKGAGA